MKWFRRKQKPPREGWVVLMNGDHEASERIPVVVHGDPLNFTVEHGLTFKDIEPPTVTHVRVYDIDGVLHDVPLNPDA